MLLGLSQQLPLPIQITGNTGFSYCSQLQGRKIQRKDGCVINNCVIVGFCYYVLAFANYY